MVQSAITASSRLLTDGLQPEPRECDELVTFLKDLPAPVEHSPDDDALRDALQKGERLFAKIGCAACHPPQLGEVAGIYSDLLLHGMGPDSGDSGSYGVFVPDQLLPRAKPRSPN